TGSAAPRAELGRARPILIPRGGPRPWGSYQQSRAKRCADQRFPRSPTSVSGEVMRSHNPAPNRHQAMLVCAGTPAPTLPDGRRRCSWRCAGWPGRRRVHHAGAAGRPPAPTHRHDRFLGTPGDQRGDRHQGQFAFDRVAYRMGQGAGDSAQPRIADITQQDRQLQQVLLEGVAQPAQDLAGRGPCRRVDRGVDQDQAADTVGIADRQVHRDLAAGGVTKDHHR
ncbi:MAG: hypothetical protein K0S88_5941, partial [Actinomycetia bacterium]|nr:hypothetical protein [Actinomycetes bacterium]